MRSCIMPRMPTHLVQELNVGTVPFGVHEGNGICFVHCVQLRFMVLLGIDSISFIRFSCDFRDVCFSSLLFERSGSICS